MVTFVHTTMAINTDGLPLGLLDQKITAREVLSEEKIAIKKRSHNIALPIEEKESIRWLDSMRVSAEIFKGYGTKVVTVADRESDIYDLFLLADKLDTNYLIRASHNRKINKSAIHSDISGEFLWDYFEKQKREGEILIEVPEKDNQPKRIASCSIKIGKISVLPPRSFKGNKSDKLALTIFTIQVIEDEPPRGASKLEWMLHTNIPVENYDEAIEKINWYCLRWRIEVYFKVIKSGFNVERCRLETADRLIRYLAIISIVAWRVFWLTLVTRTSSSTPISELLGDEEWKILFVKFNPGRKIPERSPPLKIAIIWVAKLGGFLGRKGDGSPGITYIWRGLQKLFDLLAGARLFGHICG